MFLLADLPLKRIFSIISMIVSMSTGVTMLTPSRSDDPIVQTVQNVLNIFAGNILNNKNLDHPDVPKELLDSANSKEIAIFVKELSSLFGGK